MKKLIALAVLVVVAGLFYWQFTKPKPVAVVLGTVKRGTIEATVVNTRAGTVKACRRALLAPAIGGQIDLLPARKGEVVKAGEVLLALWNKDLKALVTLRKSQVVADHDSARAACLDADIAERQAKRYKILVRDHAVSEEEADRVISAASVQQARCQAARTAVKASEDQLRAAEAQLEQTVLRAPFAGVIADVNGEVGEYATPSPPGIPTLPAVDLVDDSCFYINAPIDEVDASAIQVGMEARITMDAFRGRSFAGKVRRIADFVLDREKQARTVDVEVEFVDRKDFRGLLPGYSADAEVILQRKKDVLQVPAEAVSTDHKVFVFHNETGLLEQRTVKTGIANWKDVEIESGLKEGERIVLSIDRKGVKDGALAVEDKSK
ncbi:MAG: efflux RND transporter periplasmic adaptor subunit [Deltaproteobacteria bacterium]